MRHFTFRGLCLRLFVTSVLLVPIAAEAFQQVPARGGSGAKAATIRTPRQIRELIEHASALPFEYRADIQLTAIELGRISDAAWENELLEDLFHTAGQAKREYNERSVAVGASDRSGQIGGVFVQNLDSLGVRTRVVRALLKRDSQKALQLFHQIRLSVPPASCTSPMVPDVSVYYQTWGELLKPGKLADKARSEELYSLANHISNAASAVQLMPLARLLAAAQVSESQLEELTYSYAQRLSRLQATDRELAIFEAAGGALGGAIAQLAAKNGNGSSAAVELVRAYRDFLARSSRAFRCADFAADRARIARNFSTVLERSAQTNVVAPLAARELEPDRVDAAAKLEPLPELNIHFTEFMALVGDIQPPAKWAAPAGERSADEMVNEILGKLDDIDTSRGPCPACRFHRKAEYYNILLSLSPTGSCKQRVFEHFAAFLANDRIKEDSPIEWLPRLKLILNSCRTLSREQADRINSFRESTKERTLLGMPSEMPTTMQDILASQNDRIMRTYVEAERVLAIPYFVPPYVPGMTKPAQAR